MSALSSPGDFSKHKAKRSVAKITTASFFFEKSISSEKELISPSALGYWKIAPK